MLNHSKIRLQIPRELYKGRFLCRNNRLQGPFCQGAMPDFAAALTSEGFDLACGKWREVVMMHITLGISWFKRIQFLGFAQSAECSQ